MCMENNMGVCTYVHIWMKTLCLEYIMYIFYAINIYQLHTYKYIVKRIYLHTHMHIFLIYLAYILVLTVVSYNICSIVYNICSIVSGSCNPVDCSPAGSFVYEILQARILEWAAISSSRGSSWPRDWTWVSCIDRQILYHWATREAPFDWTTFKSQTQSFFIFSHLYYVICLISICVGINPMDRAAWRATIHGVTKSQTRLMTEHACLGVERTSVTSFLLFFKY